MPTFPPDYGFPMRTECVVVVPQQERNSAQPTLRQRDYAHHSIPLLERKRDSFPNFLACKQELHARDCCEDLNYVQRMEELKHEPWLLQQKKQQEQSEVRAARSQGSGEVGPPR